MGPIEEAKDVNSIVRKRLIAEIKGEQGISSRNELAVIAGALETSTAYEAGDKGRLTFCAIPRPSAFQTIPPTGWRVPESHRQRW